MGVYCGPPGDQSQLDPRPKDTEHTVLVKDFDKRIQVSMEAEKTTSSRVRSQQRRAPRPHKLTYGRAAPLRIHLASSCHMDLATKFEV